MREKSRNFIVTGAWVLILALLIFFCAQALAQEAQQIRPARQTMQQRAFQAVVAFTSLGMFFVVVLAVGIGALAIQLWARVTFPNRTAAVLKALEGKRWRLFLIGLVNLVFLMALFICFCNVRSLRWLGLLVGMVVLALVLLGLLGKAERLGRRILTEAGRAPNPIASILVGWPVLYLIGTIPLLGWALLLYLAISGTGAAVLSFIGESRPSAQEAAKTP